VLARCQLLALDRTDGERRVYGEGIERGTLVLPPRGGEGFGWDPVFLPEGETRTYGELPGEVKDEIGHRGKAWRDLVARLVADGDGGAGRDRVDQDG
jgi:XTP/dITP diphosphohydrolase